MGAVKLDTSGTLRLLSEELFSAPSYLQSMAHLQLSSEATLTLRDGVLFYTSDDQPEISLGALIAEPFKRGAKKVRLSIGDEFTWDIEEDEIADFNWRLLDKMDEEVSFIDGGTRKAIVRITTL